MKIALLNLPYDNNYGGNLQRYALMHVLESMGHEVTHINLRIHYKLPWYKKPYSYTKRFIKKYILGRDAKIDLEAFNNQQLKYRCSNTDKFYNKYIKHTNACYTIKDVVKATKGIFDAFVVGSDQVWRKDMTASIGLENFFLAFTSGWLVKRIAYGVSVGKEQPGYSKADIKQLTPLYRAFDKVSVRESCLVECFENYGWSNPNPQSVLDPTLLLSASDYNSLIDAANTNCITEGKIYCYILDQKTEIITHIQNKAAELGCDYIINDLQEVGNPTSIEQWLLNIRDARYIITDSYHGSVFSIIFNRPFEYCGNQRRGNARIENLLRVLEINDFNSIDYQQTKHIIKRLTQVSLNQLQM